MSTEQSIDPQLLEDTKQQIRGLVDEIAKLSRSDVSPQEFYDQFLNRVVQALAAVGGAVWTLGDSGALELQYQINLQETRLAQEDKEGQQRHGRLLHQVMQAGEGRMVPPNAGSGDNDDAANTTDFLLVLGPLHSGQEVQGVVEIFQRPGGQPNTQRGYLKFLLRMCELASDYLKTRKLQHLGDRQALWGQLEAFTRAVHSSLDPRETAYTLANEGRRLIQCDRVSVAIKHGRKCKIEAVSGQDTFDKRSNTIVLLNQLATAVAKTGEAMWYTGDTSNLAPQVEMALEEYLDDSHSKTVAVLPLKRKPEDENDELAVGETIGAVIVEQIEDARIRDGMLQRVEVVNDHASAALANSLQYNNLFLMPVWRSIGKMKWLVQAQTLPKTLLALGAVVVVILALIFVPWDFNLEGKGTLQPSIRKDVFAQVNGTVSDVLVKHRSEVKKDEVLLDLKNPMLTEELANHEKELAATAESIRSINYQINRGRIAADEEQRLMSQMLSETAKAQGLEKQLEIFEEQIADLKVRSPSDGVVITWDIEDLLRGRPVQAGQALLTVADPSGPWELEVLMPEDRMGFITEAQNEMGKDLTVEFIMASDPGTTLTGTIERINEAAEVRGEEGSTVMVIVKINKEDIKDLRPGAGLTAKVVCGRRSLGYVLFHDLAAWIQSRVIFSWF